MAADPSSLHASSPEARNALHQLLRNQHCSALAPMQDVTTRAFMSIIAHYGAPDLFFTEYFRVHSHSTLEPHILDSILHHNSGRPIFAQLIGEDIPHMLRTVALLQQYPVAGIDLNMGCPAPKVYKKNVGGGLLRDLPRVDQLLGALRQAIAGPFTVKMRIGFEDQQSFAGLLDLIDKHSIDLLSLHARTVRQMYRGEPDYSTIATAASRLSCPVLANGNLSSATKAVQIMRQTGCAGVMMGRSAIRNPWIFAQFKALTNGNQPIVPALQDVRCYIDQLWNATHAPGLTDRLHVARLKKFLNFIGEGVDPQGAFLYAMRRALTPEDLFSICDQFLLADDRGQQPFAAEPFHGVTARPNHEASCCN